MFTSVRLRTVGRVDCRCSHCADKDQCQGDCTEEDDPIGEHRFVRPRATERMPRRIRRHQERSRRCGRCSAREWTSGCPTPTLREVLLLLLIGEGLHRHWRTPRGAGLRLSGPPPQLFPSLSYRNAIAGRTGKRIGVRTARLRLRHHRRLRSAMPTAVRASSVVTTVVAADANRLGRSHEPGCTATSAVARRA